MNTEDQTYVDVRALGYWHAYEHIFSIKTWAWLFWKVAFLLADLEYLQIDTKYHWN